MKPLIITLIIVLVVAAVAGFLIFSGGNEQDINPDLNLGNSDIETLNNNTKDNTQTEDNTSVSVTQPQTYDIKIKSFSFQPPELKIKAGDTVTWTNRDSASHTVTSDSGNEIGSSLLSKEETYSHTFMQTGTFAYHCRPHSGMKASIIVE